MNIVTEKMMLNAHCTVEEEEAYHNRQIWALSTALSWILLDPKGSDLGYVTTMLFYNSGTNSEKNKFREVQRRDKKRSSEEFKEEKQG